MPNINLPVAPLIILGGTFDPIHNGHLQLASYLFDLFATPITFMPTGIQDYKAMPQASNQDRLAMLKLAIANQPQYLINTLELDSTTRCCTYDTLNYLANTRNRSAPAEFVSNKLVPIFFVIGSDSWLQFSTWDKWQDLSNLANFIIVNRVGYDLTLEAAKFKNANPLLPALAPLQELTVNASGTSVTDMRVGTPVDTRVMNRISCNRTTGKFYLADFTPLNVSSTLIRSYVRHGLKIDHLVPAAVSKYIASAQLYC